MALRADDRAGLAIPRGWRVIAANTDAAPWSPDPVAFLADLEAKPRALDDLARSQLVATAIRSVPTNAAHLLFLGMGSSRYAAEVAALRLRSLGRHAVAEYASARHLPPPRRDCLVVGISASGSSDETITALERFRGRAPTLAITENLESPLATMADFAIPLQAGRERGGVACRSFQHTGLVLGALEDALIGRPSGLPDLCRRVAAATIDLLDRRGDWLPGITHALDGPDGVHILAPVERWSSAAQSALMLREGPRRVAAASETGDWNHVDVYLTKTTDYRALLLTGSPYDEDALEWIRRRGSVVVSVGASLEGSQATIRYDGDHDESVALHTETLVAELLAAQWWLAQERVDDPLGEA